MTQTWGCAADYRRCIDRRSFSTTSTEIEARDGTRAMRAIAAKGKRLLTTREIAARYGLGYSTLTKLRGAGGGSRYILIGRKVMYDEADFEVWLDSKRRTSTSQVDG